MTHGTMEGMSSEGGKLNGIPTARRCFGGVISLSIGSSLLTPAIHRSVHSAHAPCARLRVLLWRSGPGTGGAMKQIEENSMTDTSVTVLGLQFTVQLSYFLFLLLLLLLSTADMSVGFCTNIFTVDKYNSISQS